MRYGGDTLEDYYEKLETGEAEILSEENKNKLFKRLAYMVEMLGKHGLTYCDLKPDNIVFDPNNIDQTRLIDFGSVIESKKQCVFSTANYSAPEYYSDRRHYNAVTRSKKFFTTGINDETKFDELDKYRQCFLNKIETYKKEKAKYVATDDRAKRLTEKIDSYANLSKFISNYLNQIQLGSEVNPLYEKSLDKIFVNAYSANCIKKLDLYDYSNESNNTSNFDIFNLGVILHEYELTNIIKNHGVMSIQSQGHKIRTPDYLVSLIEEYNVIKIPEPVKIKVHKNYMTTAKLRGKILQVLVKIEKTRGLNLEFFKELTLSLIAEKHERQNIGWLTEKIRNLEVSIRI